MSFNILLLLIGWLVAMAIFLVLLSCCVTFIIVKRWRLSVMGSIPREATPTA